MKPRDIVYYLKLRRLVEHPWRTLRAIKKPPAEGMFDIRFLAGNRITLRSRARDAHDFHHVFLRDDYRLDGVREKEWECVIDVGGHIGLVAARAATLARRVLTFEPMPDNFEMVKMNLSHEGFAHVSAFNAAVCGQAGTIKMYRSENSSTHSVFHHEGADGGTVEVPAVTLNQVFTQSGVETCDLLKLDCEGSEYQILYDASDEVLARVARIYMEYHPWGGGDPRQLAAHLRKKGFQVETKPSKRRRELGMMFCRRNASGGGGPGSI